MYDEYERIKQNVIFLYSERLMGKRALSRLFDLSIRLKQAGRSRSYPYHNHINDCQPARLLYRNRLVHGFYHRFIMRYNNYGFISMQ